MSERKVPTSRDRVRYRRASAPSRGEIVTRAQAALRALGQASALLRQVSDPYFGSFGLSPAQWGVLRSLTRLEKQGLSQPSMGELGAALIVHPPSLSATLDRMVRAGLIERRKDAHDGRARRILLTAAGRSVVARVLVGHHQWIDGVMAGLSAKELGVLLRLLRKLSGHMHGVADERAINLTGDVQTPPGEIARGRRRST